MTRPVRQRGGWSVAWVHGFTALGVVCALFAVLAVSDRAFEQVFAWLGIAFFIDAVDGLFARKVRVKERLPRFSGDVLDLVIDYLTYVFVPVLALLASGILSGDVGIVLASLILMSALFHFADNDSKSTEYAFIGFPAIWNVVAFYFFAFQPETWVVAGICVALIILTFVRWPWVHPVRVRALRPVTLTVAALWCGAALTTLYKGFPAHPLAQFILIAVVVYGLTLSLFWRRLPGHH